DFGILSPKMIMDMASIKIEQPELYDPDGYPIDGGLSDLHLGVVDPGLRCRTCGGTIGQCLGHFGYLELVKPVVNPLYGKHIYAVLRSICGQCSRILLTTDELQNPGPGKDIYKKAKKVCPHCNAKQKGVTYQKPTSFRENDIELTSEEIRQRLERIPDDDVKILGIQGGRPEWLILTLLPIPPVTVRPSITLETGERSEDDLTHKLVDVVRINERLRKNLEIGAPDFIIADIWELLQYHISTLMDNEISSLPPARHRSGRSLKTLVQRLSKKEGRFRGNLSGKRVNFSARTVISPDPWISINEVGVPLEIALQLTVPIKVTKNNLEDMKKLVLSGPTTYPGANYVVRSDAIRKKITDENKEVIAQEIDINYIVERHLMDGDTTILNRQPSLHRMSMMCHRAKIMPAKTFRINLAVTVPYNADFDGDEMNLHVPQTEEAQSEAEMLMLVQKNMRSPRYGLPVVCGKHDHITGSYLLTREGSKFSKRDVAQILLTLGVDADDLKDSYTGKEVFSFLLPKDLNITFKASFGSDCKTCTAETCTHDSFVIIKNGVLKKGIIDESALGEKKGKLIDIIHQKYGDEVAKTFIDNLTRLALIIVSSKGFSISINEVDIGSKSEKKVEKVLEDYGEKAKDMLKDYHAGKLPKSTMENKILQMGGMASNETNTIIRKSIPLNAAVIMAKTGARGSFVNLTQICGFVGQESLEGERIHRGYTNRTLPHFIAGDLGLAARGFVSSGYKKGLEPFEFFFDSVNSRENLMDKSLHTRHSGYMERRLINALQDLRVHYDGTVRNSKNNIVQFVAGEDGLDPSKTDGGKIDFGRVLPE
ncbi:MAG: DNA-directed RNA polymerase subunit A', partial [Candidatus Aenigmarchaeota archaeon]|nr:DNA-directed RNA polymerase subunit A' [Candidatus Aenigmarchaeota archaeon]